MAIIRWEPFREIKSWEPFRENTLKCNNKY
jgi:hypothetical protein